MLENEHVSTQEAAALLRKMVSPELRFSGLRSCLGNLAQYDPDAARVYLARRFGVAVVHRKLLKSLLRIALLADGIVDGAGAEQRPGFVLAEEITAEGCAKYF